MPPDSQYSMLPHYQFEFHTKLQNFKKNVFTIYAYVIHTCLDVATKTRKLQKNAFMIYAYVIHTCSDHSYMFRCSYKNQKTTKKCIHDICLCYSYMSRCCINGRGSVPSVISKRTPTNWCSLQPASCRGHHLHTLKIYYPTIESKNAKPNVRVYYMCPREQDPLRQPRWHQFPSALAASASCGTSFGLL